MHIISCGVTLQAMRKFDATATYHCFLKAIFAVLPDLPLERVARLISFAMLGSNRRCSALQRRRMVGSLSSTHTPCRFARFPLLVWSVPAVRSSVP